MGDVISLEEKLIEKVTKDGTPQFQFLEYTYDVEGLGYTDGDEPMVVMLTDPSTLTGIAMTPEDAVKLGEGLVAAGKQKLKKEAQNGHR